MFHVTLLAPRILRWLNFIHPNFRHLISPYFELETISYIWCGLITHRLRIAGIVSALTEILTRHILLPLWHIVWSKWCEINFVYLLTKIHENSANHHTHESVSISSFCLEYWSSTYVCSDFLWAGWSRGWIPGGGIFTAPVQTGPGAHPASCAIYTGSLSRG